METMGKDVIAPAPPANLEHSLSERIVLTYLANRLQTSTPELARHTGMPGSTLAGIMARLESKGLITATKTNAGKRGRPIVAYHVRLPRPVFACVFSGTQIAGSAFDRELKSRPIEVQNLDRNVSLDEAANQVKRLLERLARSVAPDERPSELALTINAVPLGNRVWASSVLPWATDDIESRLAQALSLPVRTTKLTAVLAEYQKLADPAPQSFVHFHIGDGLSSHMVVRGKLHEGCSSRAGELGHVVQEPNGALCGCGRRGCLEAYCSGPAIHHQALAELQSGVATVLNSASLAELTPCASVQRIWEAWLEGDRYARDVMARVFDRLGWGLGIVMNMLDPELVVCSGYVIDGKPEWLEEIRRHAQRWMLYPENFAARLELGRATLEDELRVIAASYFS
jgi:glucokinase